MCRDHKNKRIVFCVAITESKRIIGITFKTNISMINKQLHIQIKFRFFFLDQEYKNLFLDSVQVSEMHVKTSLVSHSPGLLKTSLWSWASRRHYNEQIYGGTIGEKENQ